MNKIINHILCEIKILKELFSKKIKILLNNNEIENNVSSINFTGDGVVDVITNSLGETTVVINNTDSTGGTTQIQSDWTQVDTNALDFIKNKPTLIPSWNLTGNTGTNPTNSFIGTIDNQDVVFRRNNVEVARITTGERIGIGVTNPTAKLQVSTNNNVIGYSLAQFENSNNDGLAFASVRHSGTGVSIGMSSTGSNYVTSYDAHQNANIASTGPARSMRIISNGDLDTGGNTPISLNPGGFIQPATGIFHKDYVRLGFAGSEPNQVNFTTDSRIGIGTFTPTAIIDVKPSTSTNSHIRLRAGVDKSSPNNGDLWFTGNELKMQINGSTKNFAFENIQNTYFGGNYDITTTTAITENYIFQPLSRYRITAIFHIDINTSSIQFSTDIQFIHIPSTFTVSTTGYVKIESYIDYIDDENVISTTTYSNFGGATQNSGFKALNVSGGITNSNTLRYQITPSIGSSVFFAGITVEKI